MGCYASEMPPDERTLEVLRMQGGDRYLASLGLTPFVGTEEKRATLLARDEAPNLLLHPVQALRRAVEVFKS